MIVLLGDALLDLYADPLGSTVATAERFLPRQGGATANVAAVLGLHQVPCRLMASVGADAHGDRLVAELATAGVDVSGVIRVGGHTGVVFIEVAPTGERSFVGYGGGAERSFSLEALRDVAPDPLAGARLFHLGSGAVEGGALAAAAWTLLDQARARGVPVSVDLNVRVHRWADRADARRVASDLAARAAVLRASEDDLAAIGLAPDVRALAALAPGAVAILTRAERGAEALLDGELLREPAREVDAVDATGAGDAFTAGVIAVLAGQGLPGVPRHRALWEEALRTGCDLGARAVGAVGATAGLRTAPM